MSEILHINKTCFFGCINKINFIIEMLILFLDPFEIIMIIVIMTNVLLNVCSCNVIVILSLFQLQKRFSTRIVRYYF